MSTDRRDFMKSALALGAAPALSGPLLDAIGKVAEQGGLPPLQPDQGAVDFWN